MIKRVHITNKTCYRLTVKTNISYQINTRIYTGLLPTVENNTISYNRTTPTMIETRVGESQIHHMGANKCL